MSSQYYLLLSLLLFLSTAPFCIFTCYAWINKDPNDAWYIIRYIQPQIAVWIFLGLTILYGIVKSVINAARKKD